jgi:ubiquinone/menaquinone biosynthesis C-methylase UbiE
MSLDHTKKTYEKLGREDPFYAVLTVPRFRHNKWDVREFFETGEREIADILAYVAGRNLPLVRGRALDFGCGVGRLSQALGDHFESVVGVDIAESMVERARELNRHGERVEYMVNAVDHLQVLPSASFDFVYSSITLQHSPPESSRRYIAEFMRLLKPGGIAVFQVPNGKVRTPGSWQDKWYRFRRHQLRRWWKIVRGKPPYEMHYIPRADVEQIVATNGGTMIDIVPFGEGGPNQNFRYCAIRAV